MFIKVLQLLIVTGIIVYAQENQYLDSLVTDYDGNIYQTVKVGNQIWLKQNMNAVHYSDGTIIPGAVSYNNNDSLGNIYGKLYSWSAAMKNSTVQSVQGICPCGWHIPSDAEWRELENYLGGPLIAGGKMKETGTEHWLAPNKDASNLSGLSIRGGGEYDAHYTPYKFQALKMYAVFWTSTSITSRLARERYLAYDSSASMIYDWYKEMKYSIRCVKDTLTVDIKGSRDNKVIKSELYLMNFPNPFNPSTILKYEVLTSGRVNVEIYNILGEKVAILFNGYRESGVYTEKWQPENLPGGIYFCLLKTNNSSKSIKIVYVK